MKKASSYFPDLGFGLGLRIPHYPHIFEHWPKVDWFEIISENFMDTEGRPIRNLAKIRERYPIVLHGIAMSIGTVDPINSEYLKKLKRLMDWVKPAWVSDHLCWTGIAHKNSHDLLPVPYTEEALKHIVGRIKHVQDFLERPIALENPSTYLEFKTSHIPEAEFIARMAEESGCHLLLDVNNVYVSCYNHRLDPKAYIDALPLHKVAQIHLSGHTNNGTHIVDTHDDHVVDGVWSLYKYVIHQSGRTINTMVEWDDHIPEFAVLDAELTKAKVAARDAKNYAPLPDLARDQTRYVANIRTSLKDAETRMQDAILMGKALDSKPDEWIRAKAEFAPADQLAVYVNAYRYRLYEVTMGDFPVLKYYLGDEAFDRLIDDFVNHAQSEHFNISRYPVKLPQFLSKHQTGDAFAVEIAELENTISQLHDAEETVALEPKHLEGLTPEALMESVLKPRKALKLLAPDYPINAYYRAVKEEQSPKKPRKKKSYLIIFRHEDSVWRMDLEKNEYYALERLFSGKPIGVVLESLPAELGVAEEELSTELMQWFGRWIRNGILAADEVAAAPKIKNAV